MLPHGLDSNVTQLLANLLTKPSVFYYLPIVSCNLVSIQLSLLLLLLLLLLFYYIQGFGVLSTAKHGPGSTYRDSEFYSSAKSWPGGTYRDSEFYSPAKSGPGSTYRDSEFYSPVK